MSAGQPPPPALPLQRPPGYHNRDPNSVPIQLPPPPKAANLPPPVFRRKRRRTCCRTFCCCLCILILIIIVFFAAAGAFFYFWFQPSLPEINLKSISFSKFNITSAPDGTRTLDAQSTTLVVIKNPNKNLRMEYDRTQIFLNAAIGGSVNLGEQSVPGFIQGKDNVTALKFATRAWEEVLDDDKSAEGLRNGFKSKSLLVNAELRSGIGVKGGGWSVGIFPVKVLCGGVRLTGGATSKCRIKMLKWYV